MERRNSKEISLGKRFLYTGLGILASQAVAIPATNTLSFLEATVEVGKFGSVEVAKEERAKLGFQGFPFNCLSDIYEEPGRRLAYSRYDE